MRVIATPVTSLLATVGLLSTGCQGAPEDVATDWATTLSESEVRPLANGESGCRACIQLDSLVALGDTSGPGYVVHTEFVVQDSSHRYWLGQYRDMVKVFDSSGRYVATVGRPGTGPGDFDMPMPLFADSFGRVHIVDIGTRRETIASEDLSLHTGVLLPGSPWAMKVLNESGRFVANMPVQTTTGLGHPLHLIHDGELVHSFGAPSIAVSDPFRLRRIMAVDYAGRIYSTPTDKLSVEVWTDAGQRITGFEELSIRDTDPEPTPDILNTPGSSVGAIHVDQRDRLWVLIQEPHPDWRSMMKIITLPRGQRSYAPIDDGAAGSLQSTRILVVSLSDGKILADFRRPEAFVGFLGDSKLFALRQLSDGVPQVVVWSLAYNAAPQQ